MKNRFYTVLFLTLLSSLMSAKEAQDNKKQETIVFYSCEEVKQTYKDEISKNLKEMLLTKDLRLKKDEPDKKAILTIFLAISKALKEEKAIFAKRGSEWFFVVGTKDEKEAQDVIDEKDPASVPLRAIEKKETNQETTK